MRILPLSLLYFLLPFALATGALAANEPAPSFGRDFVSKAVGLSLQCAGQAQPNIEDECLQPRVNHPAFFGCFDWHSSVHGHWAMLRALHAYPDLPEREKILQTLNGHLTKENIQRELSYFEKHPMFERTYGWAWFLRLAAELKHSPLPEAAAWREAVAPLEKHLVEASRDYLNKLDRPMRVGAHPNTAFSLTHLWDYSVAAKDEALQKLLAAKARQFYGADKNCPLDYEPSSGDFVSPCFTEADLMRRVLPKSEFAAWLNRFLPKVEAAQLKPVLPVDDKDYILVHLLGLTFEKANALRGVADALPAKDSRKALFEKAAAEQAAAGWQKLFTTNYGGTHWIATFAIFYYDRAGS